MLQIYPSGGEICPPGLPNSGLKLDDFQLTFLKYKELGKSFLEKSMNVRRNLQKMTNFTESYYDLEIFENKNLMTYLIRYLVIIMMTISFFDDAEDLITSNLLI